MGLSRLILNAEQDKSDLEKLWYPLSSDPRQRNLNDETYKTAINFLLPNFLLVETQNKQHWSKRDLVNPNNIYQASLRLGVRYEDTVFAYVQLGVLSDSDGKKLMKAGLSDIKRVLIEGYEIDNIDNIDVWCISHQDEGSLIHASSNDLFVMKLKQNCSAGYLWNFDALKEAGFAVLKDWTEVSGSQEIGRPSRRRLIAKPDLTADGDYVVEQSCPWRRTSTKTKKMAISYRRRPKLKEGLYFSEFQQRADLDA